MASQGRRLQLDQFLSPITSSKSKAVMSLTGLRVLIAGGKGPI